MNRPVQPDDPPLSTCTSCGTQYNPYGHTSCPVCNDDEDPCSSVDCRAPDCPTDEAAEAFRDFTDRRPTFEP